MNFDSYINKALDSIEKSVVEPLQSKAFEAINEHPVQGGVPVLETVPPSAVASAKRCLEFWKEFDLEGQRAAWDEKGMEISAAQEKARKAKHELEAKAKAEGGTTGLAALYQQELARADERAKLAETAFLHMYKMLSDAPDPMVELQQAAEATERYAEASGAARKLAEALEFAQKDAKEARSFQQQVRRLEERTKELEEELEVKAEQAAEQRAKEGARDFEALRERDAERRRELEDARTNLAKVQEMKDKSEEALFALQSRAEEGQAERQQELEGAQEEVERAVERAAALEREGARLAAELESLRAAAAGGGGGRAAGAGGAAEGAGGEGEGLDAASMARETELEASVAAKERVVSRLHAELQGVERTLSEEREQHAHTVHLLHQQVDDKHKLVEHLKAQLGERPSAQHVAALRRRLAMLQAMVESEDAGDGDEMDGALGGGEDGGAAAVQGALRERNRKLVDELTRLRREGAEGQEAATALRSQVEILQKEKAEATSLIIRLEHDLLRAGGGGGGGGDGAGEAAAGAGAGGEGGGGGGGDDDMLAIVCGQRERLRSRVRELEEEVGALGDSLAEAKKGLDATEADNVQLYEKIRYLERYSQQRVAEASRRGGGGPAGPIAVDEAGVPIPSRKGKAGRYSCGVGPVQVSLGGDGEDDGGLMRRRAAARLNCFGGDVEVGGGGAAGGSEAEARYKKAYEERVNPFSAFSRIEEEEGVGRLRVHDRLALMAGRLLLGSKGARLFASLYVALLHVFLMVLLFSSASGGVEYVEEGAA